MKSNLSFISHSSSDEDSAQIVAEVLETGGQRCWMAPRDIKPGGSYPVEIQSGLDQSSAVVLLLSAQANQSAHVFREVESALQRRLPIFPVRIEPVLPDPGLAYLIGVCQWIDAFDSPREESLRRAAARLRQAMGSVTSHEPVPESLKIIPGKRIGSPWLVAAGLAAALVGAAPFFPGLRATKIVNASRTGDPQAPISESGWKPWRGGNDFELNLTLADQREMYREGDKIQFLLESPVECYAALILVTGQGEKGLLFPTESNPDGFIAAGVPVVIPPNTTGKGSIKVTPPFGRDEVYAIAFTQKEILQEFVKPYPVRYDGNPAPMPREVLRGLSVQLEQQPAEVKKAYQGVAFRTVGSP